MIAAIVPAAGEGRRMGRPKLLLHIDGLPVITRVVQALRDGGVDAVLVVGPPAGAPEAEALRLAAIQAGALDVFHLPGPTPDMRATIEFGLGHAERLPKLPTHILISPADCPGLSSEIVGSVVARSKADPLAIVVPAAGGRRGHPIALPWDLALAVRALPSGVGIDALVRLHAGKVVEVATAGPAAFDDLDTPEDLDRWRRRSASGGD